ncbi:MAG TPA: ATP-binding protein [Thermoanaerobaculia bacterium]|nr:ATP-binding protein [Thermoanaerobaculia bacterium]
MNKDKRAVEDDLRPEYKREDLGVGVRGKYYIDPTSVKRSLTESVLLSWSGGKDSSLALHALRQTPGLEVAGLLTTVTEDYDRISMHGVRRTLLERQAAEAGLPLHVVLIPRECTNEIYEERMTAVLTGIRDAGIRRVAFGDLFLEDIRAYRESRLAGFGMEAIFPVWGRDTAELARDFLRLGFAAVLVCVDTETLAPAFAGRAFDEDLLRDLPPGVDPCGENGEFHTFVHAGPIFRAPVPIRVGGVEDRGRFHYCDLE